jgi:hypothetical protein
MLVTDALQRAVQIQRPISKNCKLYKDQRATMMDILSENSNKEYPKSVTELLRLEEKRFVQGICYRKQNSCVYLKRKISMCTKYY